MINVYHKKKTYKKKRTKDKQKYWMCSNDFRKKRNLYKHKAQAKGLQEYANLNDFKGFLLTATPEKFKTPTTSRLELSEKFTKIRQSLKRHNILNYGYKSFEKHENGNYHLHIMIYILSCDVDAFKKIYTRYFDNYVNLNEQAIKEVSGTFNYIDDYLIWITTEDDENEEITKITEKSDVTFFGLSKGFSSKWDYVYKNKRKNLNSEQWKAKKAIINREYGKALTYLDAFSVLENVSEVENITKIKKTITAENPMISVNERTLKIIIPRTSKHIYLRCRGPPTFYYIYKKLPIPSILSTEQEEPMIKIIQNEKRYEKKRSSLQRATGPLTEGIKNVDNLKEKLPTFLTPHPRFFSFILILFFINSFSLTYLKL